jgi:hypothetical protein
LFADDTSLGYASQDEDQIKYVMNRDLHELGDWSEMVDVFPPRQK